MHVRVVTWNIRRKPHERVWEVLEKGLHPTIALLQETRIRIPQSPCFISRDIGCNKRGTAILSDLPMKKKDLSHFSCVSGTVVAAELDLGDGKAPVTVISIYGLMDKGYAITKLHHLFSDLTSILKPARKRVILGGDFNASLQCDRPPKYQAHRILFDRVKDFGLVDCLAQFREFPVQTWRNPGNPSKPWQLDYLFASESIAKKLMSCDVPADDNVYQFSDHKPVVAVFDL